MFASSIMTVAVAKVAGVKRVVAIAAPRKGEDGKPYGVYEPMLYTMATSGADQILCLGGVQALAAVSYGYERSEEHTSELQCQYLVCRLLLEKKNKMEH